MLAACGGEDSGSASTPSATVVIAVSESRIEQAMGSTEPSGVFMVVRYVLANGSDEDIVVSQDDFTLVAPDRYGPGPLQLLAPSPGGSRPAATSSRRPFC